MSVLRKPTLVLNKSWQPLSIISVKQCILRSFSESSKILDTETYNLFSFEEWVNLEPKDDNFIQTPSGTIRIPEIMIVNYNKINKRNVKLTRRNLLIRDKFRCQYTNVKLDSHNATIDHIIPRSRGGRTTWDNVVIASVEANTKKANRTLEDCGMKLLSKPERPKWNIFYSQPSRIYNKDGYPKSWTKFLKENIDMYWDVELDQS